MTDGLIDEYYEGMLKAMAPRNNAEKELVRQIGDAIGYGRTMQLCEEIWREKANAQKLTGSEHTTGPCAAFMVPCPHPIKDDGSGPNGLTRCNGG